MPKALVLVRNTVSHDARVLREAGLLQELGYDVLVVGVVSPAMRETSFSLDGIRVVRLVGPRQLAERLLRRRGGDTSANEAAEAPASARHGRVRRLVVTVAFVIQGIAVALRTSPDLVHANDYDTMWIGVAAKLLRGSRLVYDAHELWPDQDGDQGWRPWLIACEWLFVHLADARVTVSPGCAEAIARRYRVAAPVVVRNVPDRVLETAEPRQEEALAVYVGLLAPSRGLEQAVRALPAARGLRLRLIGPDAESFSAQIAREAEHAGVAERVEILPPVPPAQVIDAIAGARLGLVLIQPTSLSHRLSLPNKLFEYVAAGVPVLASDLPVIGPLVRQEGLGEVVAPDDIDGIAGAMRRLADADPSADFRPRLREFAKRSTWAHEKHLLAEVYESLRRPRAASAAS
jgi:glycosyltransferase involved in cell wall biosynthesis